MSARNPRIYQRNFKTERSAGGLAIRADGKLLMIQVRNLLGEVKWTFPKGHLEQGETDGEAALREVVEETGWKCDIAPHGRKGVFERVRYCFRRGPSLIKKEVVWFLMRPVEKVGELDPEEILQARWKTLEDAERLATYPSDKKLIQQLRALRQK